MPDLHAASALTEKCPLVLIELSIVKIYSGWHFDDGLLRSFAVAAEGSAVHSKS